MPLDFPLNNQEKGSIEQCLFSVLKTITLKGVLPIYTSIRTDKPKQGEVYLYNLSGTYRICAYFSGTERYVNLT